jgi:hypothetical protein
MKNCPSCGKVLISVIRDKGYVNVCVIKTCSNYNREPQACESTS